MITLRIGYGLASSPSVPQPSQASQPRLDHPQSRQSQTSSCRQLPCMISYNLICGKRWYSLTNRYSREKSIWQLKPQAYCIIVFIDLGFILPVGVSFSFGLCWSQNSHQNTFSTLWLRNRELNSCQGQINGKNSIPKLLSAIYPTDLPVRIRLGNRSKISASHLNRHQ